MERYHAASDAAGRQLTLDIRHFCFWTMLRLTVADDTPHRTTTWFTMEKDRRAADEPQLFESQGLSLLDAIRTLVSKRRLAPSCAPSLADAPGIVSVS